jgi:hypothetical protein
LRSVNSQLANLRPKISFRRSISISYEQADYDAAL